MKRLVALLALAAAAPASLLAQAAVAVPQVKKVSLLEELSSPFILPLWFCSALIVYLVVVALAFLADLGKPRPQPS